jgi:hypothetical protein
MISCYENCQKRSYYYKTPFLQLILCKRRWSTYGQQFFNTYFRANLKFIAKSLHCILKLDRKLLVANNLVAKQKLFCTFEIKYNIHKYTFYVGRSGIQTKVSSLNIKI